MIGELGKKNKRVEGKDGIGEGRTLSKIWMTETTCRGHPKRKCRAWKIKKETEKKQHNIFPLLNYFYVTNINTNSFRN